MAAAIDEDEDLEEGEVREDFENELDEGSKLRSVDPARGPRINYTVKTISL